MRPVVSRRDLKSTTKCINLLYKYTNIHYSYRERTNEIQLEDCRLLVEDRPSLRWSHPVCFAMCIMFLGSSTSLLESANLNH
jgi:hypothetical protein